MFGKKKKSTELGKKNSQQESPGVPMSTIPEAFYGGKNPDIYSSKTAVPGAEGATSQPIKTPEKKKQDHTRASQPLSKKKKILFVSLGLLFLLLVSAGITWIFFIRPNTPPVPEPRTNQQSPSTQNQPTQPEPSQNTEPDTEPDPQPTETPTSTEPTEDPIASAADTIEFPRVLLVDSIDLDSDGITDLEEEYYSTDSGNPDSDADGFSDGLEIENLYSPSDIAPTPLIDSGLVAEYVNPTYGYRLYHPIEWSVAAVDAQAQQVLFTAITGDFVEVVRSEKQERETFAQWFSRAAQGQRITDLISFENRFDVRGSYRQDHLVAYFDTPNAVYVMIYNPGTTAAIPFRQTMIMMYQSFRPTQTNTTVERQPVLPGQSAATSTQEGTEGQQQDDTGFGPVTPIEEETE